MTRPNRHLVLPTTLLPESDGGAKVELRFTRVIVYPGGREEIEGVTPKALPAPPKSSHSLPKDNNEPEA